MQRLIFSYILDFLIPPRAGEKALRGTNSAALLALKKPFPHLYSTALPYRDELVTHLVWELKYYKNRHAATLAAAILYEDLLALAAEEIGILLLIPVPMHVARRKSRGHNQTEVLCRALMKELGNSYRYMPHALTRTRNTPPQQGLSKEKRLHNVHESMQVTEPSTVRGRVCVVVDDVSTTGATLREAKRALRAAGAERVYCVSLAAAA